MLPPLDFTSPTFLFIFVPATLAAYYALRNSRFQNAVLAVASLAFYATTGVIYLLPLLFTCVLDYVVGAKLAQGNGAWRRWLFVGSLTVQIGLLATFKYLGWLSVEAGHLAAALGIGMMITPLAVPLPPGISFYTFHTISYTADIYRRRFRPQAISSTTSLSSPFSRSSSRVPSPALRICSRNSSRNGRCRRARRLRRPYG